MTVLVDILAVIGGLALLYSAGAIWAIWYMGKHNAEKKQLREQLHEANRRLAVAVGHPSVRKPGKLLPFPARNDDYWSAS